MAQPYVGEIRMFAGNFAPAGWMFCDGQTLAISENEVLFQLIGTTYGGDGEETFQLPNLQSRIPLHFGTGPDGTTYQIGEMSGTESVTLSTQQIPNHTHAFTGTANGANAGNPTGKVLAQSANVSYMVIDPNEVNMNAAAVTPVGGSQPHENCQPFLCINYIISLFGIFPSQT
jgi:microcystin-dependent protein